MNIKTWKEAELYECGGCHGIFATKEEAEICCTEFTCSVCGRKIKGEPFIFVNRKVCRACPEKLHKERDWESAKKEKASDVSPLAPCYWEEGDIFGKLRDIIEEVAESEWSPDHGQPKVYLCNTRPMEIELAAYVVKRAEEFTGNNDIDVMIDLDDLEEAQEHLDEAIQYVEKKIVTDTGIDISDAAMEYREKLEAARAELLEKTRQRAELVKRHMAATTKEEKEAVRKELGEALTTESTEEKEESAETRKSLTQFYRMAKQGHPKPVTEEPVNESNP